MKISKTNHGFTLIEVLIAAAILAMAGVAAILVEKEYIQSSSLSKHRLEAAAAAQEGISGVKKIFSDSLLQETDPWTVLADGEYQLDDDGNILELYDGKDTFIRDGITFTRKIIIEGPAP